MTETKPATRLTQTPIPLTDLVIGIKGAGEMATGTAWRLFQANIRHIFMMEAPHPKAVRRRVSFCEAVHDGTIRVEGVEAVRVADPREVPNAWEKGQIPVIVDPAWDTVQILRPHVVVDAIIAKRNLGTQRTEAPLVIGLGPGFEAGGDVHAVVETNRGHSLGRVIRNGTAQPNTGVPGAVLGFTKERLLRAPCSGIFRAETAIGARVESGAVVGFVDDTPVIARLKGVVRGLIRDNTRVKQGLKLGDVDPRGQESFCPIISEKARAIGGGVLEAVLSEFNH